MQVQKAYLKESVRVFKAGINGHFNPDSASHNQSISNFQSGLSSCCHCYDH